MKHFFINIKPLELFKYQLVAYDGTELVSTQTFKGIIKLELAKAILIGQGYEQRLHT